MKRILDFVPADHEVIVSRTLVMVHQAVDTAFPDASPPSARFAKTAFGSDEPTLTQGLPGGDWTHGVEEKSPRKTVISSPEGNTAEDSFELEADSGWGWKQGLIIVLVIAIGALLAYLLIP